MDQILENAVARALGLRIEPRDDDSDRRRKAKKATATRKPRKERLH